MKTTMTLILLNTLAVSAVAQESYLPLREGAVWNYTGIQVQQVQRQVDGTFEVGGQTTVVIKNNRTGGFDDEWWNFWTEDAEGRTWLHGFRNLISGVGARYDPPILWIEGATQSTSWSTETTVRDLDTDLAVENLDARFEAMRNIPIDVQAGFFSTLFLDWNFVSLSLPKTMTSRFDGLGRRLEPSARKRAENQFWYAPGVGLVRESFCCPLRTEELFSYVVVATESHTWSAVKSRYGP